MVGRKNKLSSNIPIIQFSSIVFHLILVYLPDDLTVQQKPTLKVERTCKSNNNNINNNNNNNRKRQRENYNR
jgi:hypothetical protein